MNLIMQNKVHSKTNYDRISDLPEPVRRHILSFLPTSNAVRCSVLSSNWQGLWTELSNLKLNENRLSFLLTVEKLPDVVNEGARVQREAILKERESFYRFLDRVLDSTMEMKKLDLYVPGYGSELESRLDHWLEGAVRRRIKVLKLDFNSKIEPKYCLPKSVLGANSIRKLHLQNCVLNLSRFVDARLPSLQDLSLQFVYMDDGIIESLAAVCPNLEVLDFVSCDGLTRFELAGLNKLLKIVIETSSDEIKLIKIEAPNLLDFYYMNEFYMDAEVCEIAVLACPKMRHMRLFGAQFDDAEFKQIVEKLFMLENLELCSCNRLEWVFVSNQHLVRLKIFLCIRLKKFEIVSPNLKFFHYQQNELMSLKPRGYPLNLTKAIISIKPHIRGDEWYVRFIKFLANLCHCDNLKLFVGSEEEFMIPESVRMKSCPPLHGVKNLVVQLRALSPKHTRVELVQALLWLAPCLESLSINDNCTPVCQNFKFTYEKPLEGKKICGCWKSLPINCWRHALTQVSFENNTGDEDDDLELELEIY